MYVEEGNVQMIDNRNSCFGAGRNPARASVGVDTMQILDSCKDKDCFEDVRVYLTEFGQDVIEKTGNIKVKDTKVVCVNVQVDPIQFNRGFYHITLRCYTKLTCEACLCPGKSQEIEGVAVTEKKLVLYGGEGGARVFRSEPVDDGFCSVPCRFEEGSNKPTVVVETVDPMALTCAVKEKCHCPCACVGVDEMPQSVSCAINGCLFDHPGLNRHLYVSLGFFSVVRIERPGQFIMSAEEFCLPDKVCAAVDEEDPCAVFSKMAFPASQFCSCAPPSGTPGTNTSCSCKNN